jgi:LL-diaminopimelate aminotransferase
VATKAQLAEWVAYAHEHRALILFDAAYATFIRDESLPHSVFEIEGAEEVAVEFRSYSKTAGFTGTRCAFTVIPAECRAFRGDGTTVALRDLWSRRQATKFNGVSYPVQRAAEAVYTEAGGRQIRELADYYLDNARSIRSCMESLGYACTGGVHSPYIWVNTGLDSWAFFDKMLSEAGVVCTPGSGFGRCGEGYIRLSAFNSKENVAEAMERLGASLAVASQR